MMKLGQATIQRVIDIDPFALGLTFLFPKADLEVLRPHAEWLAPDHIDFESAHVLLGVQSFIVRVGNLTIMIDSCVGEHKERARRPDWHRRSQTGYLARLASIGLRPEDIDVVLCTHLHADHVSWNTKLENGRWVPTFPRARYMIGVEELSAWAAEEKTAPGVANHGAYADSVLPVIEAGQVDEVHAGFELASGLSILSLPGHSPGQIGLELASGSGPSALFVGDAIHSPVQLVRPDWTSPFCSNAEQAVESRLTILERACGDGSLVVPSHIRGAMGFTVERCCAAYKAHYVCEP